jgi:hypothetical protein
LACISKGNSPISSRTIEPHSAASKATRPILPGTCERAFRVAKKLAFEQLLRDGRAIDSDQRFVFPVATAMNFARNQVFPGPSFTENEHRSFGWRNQIDLPDYSSQDAALTYEISKGLCFDHLVFTAGAQSTASLQAIWVAVHLGLLGKISS